jgi:hypothetical protein
VGGQLQLLPRPTGGLVARIEIPKSRTRGLSDTQAA